MLIVVAHLHPVPKHAQAIADFFFARRTQSATRRNYAKTVIIDFFDWVFCPLIWHFQCYPPEQCCSWIHRGKNEGITFCNASQHSVRCRLTWCMQQGASTRCNVVEAPEYYKLQAFGSPRLVLPVSLWFLQTSTCMNGFVKALETMRLQSGYIIVYVCVYVEWKVLKWTCPSHFGVVCNAILSF